MKSEFTKQEILNWDNRTKAAVLSTIIDELSKCSSDFVIVDEENDRFLGSFEAAADKPMSSRKRLPSSKKKLPSSESLGRVYPTVEALFDELNIHRD